MLRFFFVLTTVLAVAASSSIPAENVKDPNSNGRIVGGQLINIIKRPHQVSLRYKQCRTCPFEYLCGGNIINKKIILTAAHCVVDFNPKFMHVVAGTSERTGNGVIIPVRKFVPHQNYSKTTFLENDIAIIVLVAELPLNDFDIMAIEMTRTRPISNEVAITAGWGLTSEIGPPSDHLLEVEVRIISNEVCKSQYSERRITKSMLCAGTPKGGKDACVGDSGGPLLVNGVLAGVVSWGEGCARAGSPGVYTSVADLRPWIDLIVLANS